MNEEGEGEKWRDGEGGVIILRERERGEIKKRTGGGRIRNEEERSIVRWKWRRRKNC